MEEQEEVFIMRYDSGQRYTAVLRVPEVWDLEKQGFSLKRVWADETVDVGPADVAVLLGVIAAGAGVLSAAITATLSYFAKVKKGTIVISGKSGRKIEIPAGTPIEEIEDYIAKAKEIDCDEILIYEDR